MPARYTCFPRTKPPLGFVNVIAGAFEKVDNAIGAASSQKRFGSDHVLGELAPVLLTLGFEVEQGKSRADRIDRPVFFGEGGEPSLNYQIDAFHPIWSCGLEIEAGRGFMGNAFYRDLIQAMVMVQVDHLCIALLNRYEYANTHSNDYDKAIGVADTLFAHDRIRVPFGLTVLGYGPL
ncbi:MAG: hypothetical protein AAGK04_09380 [Planctomycetota bacterium]